jgi:hypothetical protein
VDRPAARMALEITEPAPANVRYVVPCRLGSRVVSVVSVPPGGTFEGTTVHLPPGTRQATIAFAQPGP